MAAPIFLLIIVWLFLSQGRPIFYKSDRMKSVDKAFVLIKFRTMVAPSSTDPDSGASGGHKSARVTRVGQILRRVRLDELPQLWNIFTGDMSFVGPRPPLLKYTKSHHTLYAKVLRNKPGVTGLASIVYHYHEEFLLANTSSLEETEVIYQNRCIPRKAKIDLLYQQKQSIGLDIYVLYLTAAKFVKLPGRRAARIKNH